MMDSTIISSKNRRVTRIVEYYNNLCEKESRCQPKDPQLPSLQLRISRIRELIAILSLYEDKIKYLSVDSNRIIPCNDDDKERIKFTDCTIKLVVQIVRQSFWNTSSSTVLGGDNLAQSSGSTVTPLQHLNVSSSSASHTTLPTVNVEFVLSNQYPTSHTADSLSVSISKVQNFSAVKVQRLQELLGAQQSEESSPEVIYSLIWSVTYFLHVLDSYDDHDALLHVADSSQLISQLVSVHPKHLTSLSPSLLTSVVQARDQTALDIKRKRKNAQLDQFRPGIELSDLPTQTFAFSPNDLVPSLLTQKSVDDLTEVLSVFQFKDKHSCDTRELSLRLQSKTTHCIYIQTRCLVRHRQEYSAFEPTSGLSFRFLRIAFSLDALKSHLQDVSELLEAACKNILADESLERLEKVLKIELARGCHFVEHVHFSYQFVDGRAEFYLVNEAFPQDEEYSSIESLAKTIPFNESGLLLDLRYRFLERVLVGFGRIHKEQLAHGGLEPSKMFVNSSGSMKIYDVFLDSAAMQILPYLLDSDLANFKRSERVILQSLMRDDCFTIGSLVLALWGDCHFESISKFLPDNVITTRQETFQERFNQLNNTNCAHFVKECFKIYEQKSELQLSSLLNHSFVLEWQKKNILDEQKKVEILKKKAGDDAEEESGENIPSSYDRSRREFFPVMALGKGAFGSVFMVRNDIDGTEYALKFVHLPDTKAAKDKLRREVAHLAKIGHPNIVRYYSSWFEYDAGQSWNYLVPSNDADELDLEGSDSEYDYEDDEEDEESDSQNLQNIQNLKNPQFSDIQESEDGDSFIEFASDSQPGGASKKDSLSLSFSHTQSSVPYLRKKGGKREKSEQEKKGLKLMLCIQMELCDKQTLQEKIREKILLEDHTARNRILQEMANALAYIHSQNIIHRDLKPSNVFFFGGNVKIGDFGLARTTKQEPNTKESPNGEVLPSRKISTIFFGSNKRNKKMSINFSSSANTLHIGTAQYMAPEVTLDSRYNQKIDLFSFGVIFFEMCYPMDTMSERARLLMDIRPTKTKPSIFPEDMDNYFRPIEIENLKKLLSINPAERPAAVDLLNSNIFDTRESTISVQLARQREKQAQELKYGELKYISQSNLSFIVKRLLENSTSPQFRFVVKKLMDRPMKLIDSICYDYDPDYRHHSATEDQMKKTVNFNLIKGHFDHLSGLFGGLKLANISTLLPDFQTREDAVKVCDENGVLCDLPYDRRMLLSRYLAFNGQHMDFLTCSNFSPIYRKSSHGPFHPRQVWTASFDQIWSQSWSEHRILPFCELLTLSTCVLTPLIHRGHLVYHLTCLEVFQVIADHLKIPETVWRSLLKLLRDNGERILIQSVDELKLSFQMIFESAGISERIHKFLFSLLKIRDSSPGEMLKSITEKFKEFDVPDFQELSQKLHSLVHSLESVVNLYLISTAVFLKEDIQTKIRFRFGLALLTKTAIEYQDLAIHAVYEDFQCERGTLLAVGGRFDNAIEKQENMLQQIMPSELQEAISGQASRKTSHEAPKALSLIEDPVKNPLSLSLTSSNPKSSTSPLTIRQFNKRIAAGLTFSIDKLIKLEWNTDHLLRNTSADYRPKDDKYLVDVLIVTTMSSIDTCKVIQQLRMCNLRVQVLPELFSVTEKEHFRDFFAADKSPVKSSLNTSLSSSTSSQKSGDKRLDSGGFQNVIRYVKSSKVHFVLLIDCFKKHEYGNISQTHLYSVVEQSTSGLSLYRFGEDSGKVCRFISGDLNPSSTATADRKSRRSVFRLRQRQKRLHSGLENRGLSQVDDVVAHLLDGESYRKGDKKSVSASMVEIGGQEKLFAAKERSKPKRSSSKEPKAIMARKEKAKDGRKLAKRSLSETQIRRSRSGSVISDQTPELIDVGFVAGHKIDRQVTTIQVNEFICTKLPYLINAEDKLKVLATNLIPFELLRSFASALSECFSDPEVVNSPTGSNDGDIAQRLLKCFSAKLTTLKLMNRGYSDPLERIGQKLWSWINDKIDKDRKDGKAPEDKIGLIVLMHVGERPFRYRLFSVDLYFLGHSEDSGFGS